MNAFKKTPSLLKSSLSSPPVRRNFAYMGQGMGSLSGLIAGGVVMLTSVLFFVDDMNIDKTQTPKLPNSGYIKSNHTTLASD